MQYALQKDQTSVPDAQIAPRSKTLHMSKTLMVKINGNLNAFSLQGASAGIWKPEPGQHVTIFGTGNRNDTSESYYDAKPLDTDLQAVTLSNASVTKVTVTQCKSTFCVPLGVTMNCIPGSEYTDSGKAFAFTVIPNTTVNYPQVVYETKENSTKADAWRENFPSYNASNLKTEGVLHIVNCPYKFVHANHPVVTVMHHNPELVGSDIHSIERVDGEWFKVTPDIFEGACEAIKTHILPDVCTQNLCNFQLQLHRLDGQDWKEVDQHDLAAMGKAEPSMSPEQLQQELKLRESIATNQPQCFIARIKIDYTIKAP